MNITLTTATPVEIDTQMLHEMSDEMWASHKAERAMISMQHGIGRRDNFQTWRQNKYGIYKNAADERMAHTFVMSTVDTMIAEGDKYALRNRDDYDAEMQKYATAREHLHAIKTEFDARGGWTRYYLVVSSSGHVHRHMDCFTCNNGKEPTSFALYPSLSGSTVAQAVAKLGATLCTHCFPEAPVEYCEQTKISKTAAKILLDTADEAQFDAAIAKAAAQAAKMCTGSNKPGVASSTSGWQKCTQCDNTARTMSMSGKEMHNLPRHKPYMRKVAVA